MIEHIRKENPFHVLPVNETFPVIPHPLFKVFDVVMFQERPQEAGVYDVYINEEFSDHIGFICEDHILLVTPDERPPYLSKQEVIYFSKLRAL